VDAGRADIRNEIAPTRVGRGGARVVDQFLDRRRAEAMHAAAAGAVVRHRFELFEPALEVGGQSEETSAFERHETPARLAEPRQHVLHIEDQILVNRDLAADLEPVTLAGDLHRQALGPGWADNFQRFAFGPLEIDRNAGRLQLFEESKRCFEIPDPPLVIASAPVLERRAGRDELFRSRHLGGEIPVDAMAGPIRHGKHRAPAMARHISGAIWSERAHGQHDVQSFLSPSNLKDRRCCTLDSRDFDVGKLRADRQRRVVGAQKPDNTLAHRSGQ
jgi:hypothetical protein